MFGYDGYIMSFGYQTEGKGWMTVGFQCLVALFMPYTVLSALSQWRLSPRFPIEVTLVDP